MRADAEGAIVLHSVTEWKALEGAGLSGFLTGHIRLVPQPLPPDAISFQLASRYRILGDGVVEVRLGVISEGGNLVLPRVGIEFSLPREFRQISYFGRGPHENMTDRLIGFTLRLL